MSVEIDITYEGGLHCKAVHEPSHKVLLTDAPKDNGGKGEEFSPTDLLATAFGTCIVTIMGMVAERSGWNIKGTRVQVSKEMATEPVRRIGKLVAVVTFPKGLNLSSADKAKLEKTVSSCPVKQSLHPDVKTESKFIYS